MGRLEEIPEDIRVTHYQRIKAIQKDHINPADRPELQCYWIVGIPGVGKTHLVHEKYPELYSKDPATKWWDGYNGQEVVLIDDVDRHHFHLASQLKRWAHQWRTTLEVKGGAMAATYTKLFVTSNYTIEELWDEQPIREALLRRFNVIIFRGVAPVSTGGLVTDIP